MSIHTLVVLIGAISMRAMWRGGGMIKMGNMRKIFAFNKTTSVNYAQDKQINKII